MRIKIYLLSNGKIQNGRSHLPLTNGRIGNRLSARKYIKKNYHSELAL